MRTNVKTLLIGAGLANVTRDRWKRNIRSCNRIHMPIDGKAIYDDGKEKCVLRPDNMYLLINSSSANLELLPETRYYHMYLDFRTVPPILSQGVLTVDLSQDDFLMYTLKAVQQLIRENTNHTRREAIIEGRDETLHAQVNSILKSILIHLQRVWGLEMVENATIENAMKFISEHYTEPIQNEEIADSVRVNTKYLTRLFSKNIGKTPYQCLTQYRIERGIEELRAGKTVIEAAFLSGYQNENAFRIAFKKMMGESPKSFLKHRSGI